MSAPKPPRTPEESLIAVYKDVFGQAPSSIRPLREHASLRKIFRLQGTKESVVGVVNSDPRENLAFIGFFNQHTAVEVQTGHQVNIVFTSQPPQGDQLPVIFDNCVAASESGEPENWDWILTTIQSLRDLKNRIFKKSLTEQCLKLFQNP